MKFYEEMPALERKIMVLKAVMNSNAIEGMDDAAQVCFEEIQQLNQKVESTMEKPENPAK